MPDLQDWHKRIELEAKATERTLANLRGGTDTEERPSGAPAIVAEHAARVAAVKAATTTPAEHRESAAVANRRARGPRKEETREELLSRLLDPTLTLEETARMLEVCPTTVRRYTNRGILPHERSQGNQRRFKLSSVLAFMESQARVGPKVGEE
ncbi:MAG: helix-turn-helix domain-containing protein [Capsulimonas sp.]|uniref:helix-turn-helix domain-containing protein n=1 Tax=Capsulimonas sp. TaxID=2494211 RepID=UPI003267CBA4